MSSDKIKNGNEPNDESDESCGDESASFTTNSTTSRSKSPASSTRSKRRGRRSNKSKAKSGAAYKYDSHVKENHGANIFGVAFNTLLGKEEPQVFATAGSNRCTVYECPRKGGLTLLHCYADPDPDEVFYTCAWSYDLKTSAPLLAAAGYRGVIRVIDIEQNEAVGNYIGHGQAINELKFHPHKLQLLLSGSKDHAIRLWNIQSHVCIAIFGGVEGHRDEVLSIDFNMRGDRIVSSGMDHSLKLWCLNTPEFQHKIELSHSFSQEKSTLPFPTITKHFPDFSTRDIHRNYVDCVQWFGNFVLSKSCENAIVCWKPGQLHQSFEQLKPSDSSCTIIAEFEYDECEIWFVRFGFNPWQKVIALGNQQGKVYVWEMDPSDPEGAHMTTLHNPRSVATVRQIAFSRDASVLIYVCDDATVWRWNRRTASAL
ncbi:polycomb protein esc [Drosophila sulfurigaster albostrigata]|uniref:polycomb protein esc n=1 Tax=Drosophila sulfurigaster albostrigata TaxID=89887 RepID=UPI002D21B0C8|nr:polycomb protein esc [Drosophila sulfurigaster albostrigata]